MSGGGERVKRIYLKPTIRPGQVQRTKGKGGREEIGEKSGNIGNMDTLVLRGEGSLWQLGMV